MSFDINNNIASLQAQTYLNANSAFQAKTIQRVTSGLRIINSGDDAAGLAIANGMRSDSAVLTQGIRNANDGLSTLQTIDGGINNISGLLDRARTLATQSATGSATSASRITLNNEFQNVLSEINRQAQAIGMTAGGNNAKSLSVFIGGGANNTAFSTAANKITNGTVTVDLSQSLLDTSSLGLSGNGVLGAVITAGSNNLATATGAGAGTKIFTLAGPGFDMTTIDFSANFTAAKVNNENDAVATINAAIAAKAASAPALAAANIHASIDATTGKFVLSGSSAFSVIQVGGAGAAQTLLGSATVLSSGTSTASATYATVTGTDALTFTWQNASGANVSHTVNLSGANVTGAAAATQISNDSANGGIYATFAAGSLTFTKGDGEAFTVTSVEGTAGKGIANGTVASAFTAGSLTSLDITSSSNASNAVTALAAAVTNLGTVQGTVGRSENQLGYAVNLAQSQLTNQTAAEAQIRDADLATEAANLTKAQILLQAGTAALAQANSAPQVVLALLKG